MIDVKNNRRDKIVWCLTVLLITTFTIFETYTWGKFAFLAVAIIIYGIYYLRTGQLLFPLEPFQIFMLLFSAFVFLSSLWALSFSDAAEKGITLLQIMVSFSLMYIYYRDAEDMENLLSAIKWAGYLVALYTIQFYGVSVLMSSTSAVRLANSFSNVNTIGLLCALACVVQTFQFIYSTLNWQIVMMVPCVLVISATQSRKALVFVAVGVFALYVIKSREERSSLKVFRGIIIGIILLFILYYAISNLDIFSGLNYRMQTLLAALTGEGRVDQSTKIRNDMVKLGIEWWLKYPIGGVGIGSPHIIASQNVGADHYLHNNFAELLCGGGSVGFCLYYAMHLYLFVNLLKYKRNDYKMFSFAIVWLVLMVFMDYGMVSYYSKNQWFYLMVQFLNLRFMRKKKGRVHDESNENSLLYKELPDG